MNINKGLRRFQKNHPVLREQDLSKCSYQYKTLRGKINFLGNKLTEMKSKQGRFNYQKSWRTVEHDKRKKQIGSYYHEKAIKST